MSTAAAARVGLSVASSALVLGCVLQVWDSSVRVRVPVRVPQSKDRVRATVSGPTQATQATYAGKGATAPTSAKVLIKQLRQYTVAAVSGESLFPDIVARENNVARYAILADLPSAATASTSAVR